jgi:hypothetical protein
MSGQLRVAGTQEATGRFEETITGRLCLRA